MNKYNLPIEDEEEKEIVADKIDQALFNFLTALACIGKEHPNADIKVDLDELDNLSSHITKDI